MQLCGSEEEDESGCDYHMILVSGVWTRDLLTRRKIYNWTLAFVPMMLRNSCCESMMDWRLLMLNVNVTPPHTEAPCKINKVLSHPTLPITITAQEDRHIQFFDNNTGNTPPPPMSHVRLLVINNPTYENYKSNSDELYELWSVYQTGRSDGKTLLSCIVGNVGTFGAWPKQNQTFFKLPFWTKAVCFWTSSVCASVSLVCLLVSVVQSFKSF